MNRLGVACLAACLTSGCIGSLTGPRPGEGPTNFTLASVDACGAGLRGYIIARDWGNITTNPPLVVTLRVGEVIALSAWSRDREGTCEVDCVTAIEWEAREPTVLALTSKSLENRPTCDRFANTDPDFILGLADLEAVGVGETLFFARAQTSSGEIVAFPEKSEFPGPNIPIAVIRVIE